MRFLVVTQVALLVMALFAPIPVRAADPSQSPAPSADASSSPDPSADPTPDATAEPSAAPTAEPTAAPTPEPHALSRTAAARPPEPTATATPDPTPAPVASTGYIVTFAPGTSASTQASILAAAGADVSDSIPALRLAFISVPTGSTVVADLRADGNVSSVELDRVRTAEAAPSDTEYAEPVVAAEDRLGPGLRHRRPSGSAVVAVLDTGVDAAPRRPRRPARRRAPASSTAPTGTTDPNGHGTAMAGIIAAATDNGQGIAGVGYAGVKVMPVTVLGADGIGQDSDIIEGVVWAVDHGADVINMSFSNPGYSAALQAAIDYAWAHDVVVVAATGNDGSSTATFPAGDRGVIGVSNTDQTDALNASINYGADTFLARAGDRHRDPRRRRRHHVGDGHVGLLGRGRRGRRAAARDRIRLPRTASSSGGWRGTRTRPGRLPRPATGG